MKELKLEYRDEFKEVTSSFQTGNVHHSKQVM